MLPIEICVEDRKKMDIGIPIKGHLKVMLHETVLGQHSVAMLDNFATTGNIVATMF